MTAPCGTKILKLVLALFALAPSLSLGANVIFETDHSPLVHLTIAFKGAGATLDPQGKKGMTHYVMELLPRGTSLRPRTELDLAFDRLGSQIESTVTHEFSALNGEVLASSTEAFLSLLREILVNPNFSSSEIELLRAETLGQIQEDLANDYALAYKRLLSQLFPEHPYGTPPIGLAKDVKTFSRKELISHYELMIHSCELMIIGSGNTPVEKLTQWAQDTESALRKKAQTHEDLGIEIRSTAPPKSPGSGSALLVQKPGRTQTQILIGQTGMTMLHPDYHALMLANYAFGGSSISTLSTEIRTKRGWAYDTSSDFEFGTLPKAWFMSINPTLGDTPRALELALSLFSQFSKEGLTEEEFQLAKKALVNSAGFMYNTPRKRVENRLLEAVFGTPKGFYESFGQSIQRLTLEQVNQALKKFFDPKRLQIVAVGSTLKLDKVKTIQWFEEL